MPEGISISPQPSDTGSVSVTNVVRKFTGKTSAPTVDDDITAGYIVSDIWIDETGDKFYVCLDNTDGAAVWGTGGQSASEILTLIKTVDGTGSGLDADLLDGNHAAAFEASGAVATHTAIAAAHHARYTDGEAVTAAKTVKLDDFTAPEDNTDLDATTLVHGLMPKADKVKLDGIEAGAEVNNISDDNAATLTNDSMADVLHRHSELSASDGSPNPALSVDAAGNVGIGTTELGYKLDVVGSMRMLHDTTYPTFIMGRSLTRYGQFTWDDPNSEALFQTYDRLFPFSFDASYIRFLTNGGNEYMRIASTGNVGIGMTAPTAVLHLKAGTATAGTAPLKLTPGINLTTPEAGTIEFDGTDLFITI